MKIKCLISVLPVFFITACNQDVQLETVDGVMNIEHKSPLHSQVDTTAESSTNTSTNSTAQRSTHFSGKPHAPIDMSYQYLNTAKLNQELEIRLEFRVERDTELLEVTYKAQPGLALVETVRPYIFNNMPKGATQTLTLRVIPEQAGTAYINVFASIDVNNVMQSRSFAIPVSVEGSDQTQLKINDADKASAHGMKHLPQQNVISMPASESSSASEPSSE